MKSARQTQSSLRRVKVPLPFDSVGVLTDSGVFETCRVRKGQVLHLKEHLLRLGASLKTLGVTSWDEGLARCKLVQAARVVREGYVRINVRRSGKLILHQHPGAPYDIAKILRGICLRTVPTRWPLGEPDSAQVKGSERLSGILARIEGADAPEVLRIGPHGYLTEGTVSNLFFIKKRKLVTPPRWVGVLEGVIRTEVLKVARTLRIPIEEIPITRHDLFNADEAFLTNVLMGIFPVREVDGRRIGERIPGPITRQLMQRL